MDTHWAPWAWAHIPTSHTHTHTNDARNDRWEDLVVLQRKWAISVVQPVSRCEHTPEGEYAWANTHTQSHVHVFIWTPARSGAHARPCYSYTNGAACLLAWPHSPKQELRLALISFYFDLFFWIIKKNIKSAAFNGTLVTTSARTRSLAFALADIDAAGNATKCWGESFLFCPTVLWREEKKQPNKNINNKKRWTGYILIDLLEEYKHKCGNKCHLNIFSYRYESCCYLCYRSPICPSRFSAVIKGEDGSAIGGVDII